MARTDGMTIRLAIAWNKLVERNLVDKLPEDLRGDVIPRQSLDHEGAALGKKGTDTGEDASQSAARALYARTERMLTRLRHAVLAAHDDPDDPAIAAYGELGVGENQSQNQVRLAHLATTIKAPLPGGSLEPGETIHEALARECLEELGCPIGIRHLTGVYHHAAYNSQVFISRCELPADMQVRLSPEHSEWRFFPLDQLSPVQRRRVEDCLTYSGVVASARF